MNMRDDAEGEKSPDIKNERIKTVNPIPNGMAKLIRSAQVILG